MLRSAGYNVHDAESVLDAAPLIRRGCIEVLVLGQLVRIQHRRVLAAAAMARGTFVVTMCDDCEIERSLVRADAYLDSLCPTRLLQVLREAEKMRRAA
jgi:hypothetical protein